MKKKSVVLAVSDLHAPFQHPAAFDFLADLKRKWKPDKVVILGDEADLSGISFHKKDPDALSAGDEYRLMLKEMKSLYKIFPKAQSCTSNHTSRPFRMAFDVGLPAAFIKSYREFLEAPKGWSWHDRIIIDKVVYEHGENLSGRDGAYKGMMQNKMSTVIGHLHSNGGVIYSESPFNQTFAANAGCLIDPYHPVFKYASKYRNKATLGTVVVVEGVEAHFIRMA